MKILTVIGSYRKSGNLSDLFKSISNKNSIEYLYLSGQKLETCTGCHTCFIKGVENCPLKDDHALILDRMLSVDAVIFYSPTYVLNLSGIIKNFIDRFSFLCYDNTFLNKPALLFSSARSIGTSLTLFNLENAISSWKFNIIGKFAYKMLIEKNVASYKNKKQKKLLQLINKLGRAINNKKLKKPGIKDLINFKIIKYDFLANDDLVFYRELWKNKGLLEKDVNYYNGIKVNPVKNLFA
jgi:multimeric flavodoxin WrbA